MAITYKNLKIQKTMWLLVVLLLFSSILNLAVIFPAYTSDGTAKIFVDPAQSIFYDKDVGDTFQVNVTIANMTGLAGLEFKLYWNDTLLSCTSMVENLFHSTMPNATEIDDNLWKIKHTIDNTAGYVWYTYTYQDLDRALNNNYAPINITTDEYLEGKLAVVLLTFEVSEVPPQGMYFECDLHLVDVKPGDKSALPIPCTVIDGYYKIVGPTLMLKVDPQSYTATHRNETFSINVTINSLENTSQLVGFEFKLRYDKTLLEIVEVENGTLLELFAGPPNGGMLYFGPIIEEDYVLFAGVLLPDDNGTWHAPFPSGDGTLATIVFKVIQGPSVSCDLELFDTKLGDSIGPANPINHETEDGYFIFSVETLYHSIEVYEQFFIIETVSNATISPVPMICLPRHNMLVFNASGADGSFCFVNITIPKDLMWLEVTGDEWRILIGGLFVTPTVSENSTHTSLYFTFNLSQKPIQILGTGIVSEFPISVILLLSMIAASLIAAILRQRKKYSVLSSVNGA